ncbi:MAG TPA: PAS domain S-box protein [Rhizomicrobium sp.]
MIEKARAAKRSEIRNTVAPDNDALLSALISSAADGILVTNAQGMVQIYSGACEEIFGYPKNEVVGRHAKMLMPHYGERGDCPFFDSKISAMGIAKSGETVGRRKDNSIFPVQFSVGEGELHDRRIFVTILRELTDDRNAGDAIKKREIRLRSILEAAPYAIITIDENCLIETFGPAASQLFGYAPDEAIGRDVKILMPQTCHDHQEGYRIVVGHHRDGSTFPLELTVVELQGGSKVLFSSFVHGTNGRHDAQKRLYELQAELLHVSRLSAMAQMSFAIARKLTEPLTAVMNYVKAAELVLEAPDQTAVIRTRKIMDKVSEQILHADSIIRTLRIFTERRDCTKTLESLNNLIEEAIAVCFVGDRRPVIKIRLDLDPALPPVPMDRIQIQQVLVNLIRNSIEAMQAADKRELSLTTGVDEPGFVQVTVRDTGHGLTEEARMSLFQPFITTKENGMGIGLTICQSIIDAHGGNIWTIVEPSPGATFKFQLPLANSKEFPP